MKILMLLVTLLPRLLGLMGIAEEAFSSVPKSGAKKKELVMGAAATIIGGIEDASTGGQKNSWDRIAPLVSSLVDNAAEIAFKPETGSINIEDLRS